MTSLRPIICCLLVSLSAFAAKDRVAAWQEDLELLRVEMGAKGTSVDLKRGIATRGQKDLDKLYPRFNDDITAIEKDVPKLTDGEITLRLMKLMAGAHVAHNSVNLPIGAGFLDRLPVAFTWYADALAITFASSEYKSALGARVLKIGSKTPHEVLAELEPYISHENDVWLREMSREMLRPAAVLRQIGLTDADGSVSFTLQKPGGEPFTMKLPTLDPRNFKMAGFRAVLDIPAPLFTRHQRTAYWYEYLSDSETLFIQYNSCVNDPQHPFADFARRVLAEADANPVKRVVIDLRDNGGGDSRVIGPLKAGLQSRLKKTGPVYVLIGPYTFSSAADNALEMRKSLHAKLVGETSGAKPSSYGEVRFVKMPNSGLIAQYSTKWFGTRDESEAMTPDIPVTYALADALSGRDPVLEAAIAKAR